MSKIISSLSYLEKLTMEDGQREFLASLFPVNVNLNGTDEQYTYNTFELQIAYLKKIINEIDDLSTAIIEDETILVSVKHQKLLRTCYQIIVSLGISQCQIPGLGVNLSKRCLSAVLLPPLDFTDEQKYKMLVECTDFFTRSYKIPVLKKIILTLHLSDYIAALIQLSFAPLKKPGTYSNFTMTNELHEKLTADRQKYVQTYEYLVINCFQLILMKELLVLQSVREPSPPMFVKRVIAKELSRRLLAPGGLLSLIRCFMENNAIDTGFDWKKIEMIRKIISTKHGSDSESFYFNNICGQLAQILSMNNVHYLTTAIVCLLSLKNEYPDHKPVRALVKEIFQAFDYDYLISTSCLPGTIIYTPLDVDHKVNILHACTTITNLDFPYVLITPNLNVLFLLGLKCTKNEELKVKLKGVLLKCLQHLDKKEIANVMTDFLFGKDGSSKLHNIKIEEYDSGLTIKYVSTDIAHNKEDALLYFLYLLKSSTDMNFIKYSFEASLQIVINFDEKRKCKPAKETLLTAEDDVVLFDNIDEQYVIILQLLSELSILPKVISALRDNSLAVLDFVEHFLLKNRMDNDEECVTVALVLLNTILSNSKKCEYTGKRFTKLIPILQLMSKDESSLTSILCKEALTLITSEKHIQIETEYTKAIADAFDNLLPVRAHGLIALTKLIDAKDAETISKKHYVFCLFQEQLKDPDSYIYLSAINGIASLGTLCTDDVLHVLCEEFIKIPSDQNSIDTKDAQNKTAELRMKIGDVIVRVTRNLGDMAVLHKTILMNTMLCGCREEDPLIRTSALSNLAEIALVLHYRMGTIIYEVLHCVWSILETDKAIECRRAAVMVVSSIIKGLGKEILIQLKDDLLPIYRTLKQMYNDNDEDSVLRLHAQIALEELNDIVNQFLFPQTKMEKQIFVLDKPNEIFSLSIGGPPARRSSRLADHPAGPLAGGGTDALFWRLLDNIVGLPYYIYIYLDFPSNLP